MNARPVPQQWNSPAPSVAIVPGVVLTVVGLWALLHGDISLLAVLAIPIGATATLLGAVAKGVEWGIALERQHRSQIPD